MHSVLVSIPRGSGAEARLLHSARANPAAFASIYERYLPRVYRYCLRRLDTREAAEDATAVVFTRALAGLDGYRGGSVAAWLFRIAHRTVANELRARRPAHSLETASPIASELNVLDRVVRAEELQRVARALATLPAAQRELLALKAAGELSAREIGAVLGKSEGAVRVALHRAVQQLREALRTERNRNHG
jgi:RNA polymerase sigma-70 factor (ECF subfamily)